tara:strand:- start:75 stop:401 length:327 start_codon:yes stop_codon:yes gene_type:complete
MKDLEKITKKYFSYFSNKDLSLLREVFDENIELIDWNIKSFGIENVLYEFKKIFLEFNDISIQFRNIYYLSETVICEIIIQLDKLELKVVDIISFKKNKIISINAYKQ